MASPSKSEVFGKNLPRVRPPNICRERIGNKNIQIRYGAARPPALSVRVHGGLPDVYGGSPVGQERGLEGAILKGLQ
ncbi:unnamed protein product [Nesidiocoris tenuis]|uniref:Uncharacterized protein n=1 Tax=Nesidiocoris tenuis TaxID=355587 RepID=A0A6H5GMP3_9HEMI|nr:unnamed protein product [Nesidiocoris tenuis]